MARHERPPTGNAAGTVTVVGIGLTFSLALLAQGAGRAVTLAYGPGGGIAALAIIGGLLGVATIVFAHRSHFWDRLAQLRDQLRPRWQRPELLRIHGEPSAPARVVVANVSRGRGVGSIFAVMRHHQPVCERLYALHTPDDEARASLAAIVDEAIQLGWDAARVIPVELPPSAVDDPNVTYGELERIYREVGEAGIAADDVVLNYTGGTKAFTAAMVLAGACAGRRLEYVSVIKTDADGRAAADAEVRVIEVELSFAVAPQGPPR